MSDNFTAYGDPKPLATFSQPLIHYAARKLATQYAKRHLGSSGYIMIKSDGNGHRFYEIKNGKARSVSADMCEPKLFEAQRRRIAEDKLLSRQRKNLRSIAAPPPWDELIAGQKVMNNTMKAILDILESERERLRKQFNRPPDDVPDREIDF